MKSRRSSRKQMESVHGLPGPGDGLDPRFDQRGEVHPKVPRKTLQLCGQVARTVEAVLAEQADDTLRELHVVSVVPAPDESRLLITVGPLTPTAPFDPVVVMAHLQNAAPHLRSEVAAAITRRRAPGLAFQVTTPP